MQIICLLLGLGSCLWTFWEDIRFREIHIIPFILFGLSGIGFHWAINPNPFFHIGVNALILGILFLTIILVYRLKGEREIMDKKIGWGDWAFILGLGIWLDTNTFILFYACSIIIITAGFLLIQQLRNLPKTYPIPLAGLLAVGFTLFFPLYFFDQIL